MQAQRIANHVIRHIVFNIDGELKAFIVRRMGQQRHHLIQGVAKQERDAFKDKFARLQLREIQHIINNGQQIIGRTFNRIKVIALGGIEVCFQRQTGKADDAIERGTQFMGHISQEFRFDTCGFLGAFFG